MSLVLLYMSLINNENVNHPRNISSSFFLSFVFIAVYSQVLNQKPMYQDIHIYFFSTEICHCITTFVIKTKYSRKCSNISAKHSHKVDLSTDVVCEAKKDNMNSTWFSFQFSPIHKRDSFFHASCFKNAYSFTPEFTDSTDEQGYIDNLHLITVYWSKVHNTIRIRVSITFALGWIALAKRDEALTGRH